MTLYFDPMALTADARKPLIWDIDEVVGWLADGREPTRMGEEYERRYNMRIGPATWGDVRQLPRATTPSLSDLVPWAVRPEHRWAYSLSMLAAEARRRAGHPLTEHDAVRLTSWQANLREGDLVVHYDPDSEEGFSLVPRRPGVDPDLIRDPGR